MQGIDWRRSAAITVTVAGVLLFIYLVGNFAIGLLLPFLLAFLLALLTRPVVLWLSARTRCPLKALSVAVTLGALLLLGGLCYLAISRLLLEIKELLTFLAEDLGNEEGKIARFLGFFKDLFSGFPLFDRLGQSEILQYFPGDPDDFMGEQLRTLFSGISERMTAFAAMLLSRAPSLLIFLLVTLISCFYFSVEYDVVCRAFSRLLPTRYAQRFPEWKRRAGGAVKRYVRAYLLLFLLTFAELLLGFMILGTEYALLLAFITALLDALPVLGVGTVLLPYAIFAFVTGSRFLGFGLLILYGVITLVRQIIEPHLVGKSLGLHPILSLVAFYVGWKLFGIVGVFLGPVVALLLKFLLVREDVTNETRSGDP